MNKSESPGIMSILLLFFIGFGVLYAGFLGDMKLVSEQSFESAKSAVQLSISLIGVMAFWLGMMKVLECAGVVSSLAKALHPLFSRLFSNIPKGHPAIGAMTLNISANIFGLGNAATPFGIRAMEELQKINPNKNLASHAMCLFLAINTSGVALFPLGVIGIRAAAGATDPAGIWLPTLFATFISTVVGVLACLIFSYFSKDEKEVEDINFNTDDDLGEIKKTEDSYLFKVGVFHKSISYFFIISLLLLISFKAFYAESPRSFFTNEFSSFWFIPVLILLILSYSYGKGVRLYDAAIEGAKEGFNVAVRIIPFLVVILVAIGIFRTSGALSFISQLISSYTMIFGLPADVLPMAILRPLSGSGAFAVMSEIVSRSPDSYEAFVASVLMGSTETTFYVVTIYFGAIGVVKFRYAIICGLMADFAGVISASLISKWWFD